MEGGALFNPGFLGGSFLWWVGQIADDSTWRDNILSGKFENKNSIPGWGRRYKVRIIGLHDKEEETIPSDQLPWAQVMYPITAGGGQTNSKQTPNLRQGNFVFGFFLDGQDQQVPVIMGVLGNNAQTALKTQIGNNDSNFAATSGFAEGKEPKGPAKEQVPDEALVVTKPKTQQQVNECAPPPPGVPLNKYGLVGSPTQQQRADIESKKAELADRINSGEFEDLTEAETAQIIADEIKQAVATGIKNRCSQANSASAPSQPGATKENPDAVHEISASDVKREDKYQEKIVVMKPGNDKVRSAIKAIQTVMDELTQKINKYLSALGSYIDAVSNTISDIKKLISDAACQIAKYMKIIMDKMMEFVLKKLNAALTSAVSAMPSNMRFMFSDMKEIITELVLCLYGKMTGALCGLIQSLLDDALQARDSNGNKVPMDEVEDRALENLNGETNATAPFVPMCAAESIVGKVIAFNKDEIDDANNSILDNINGFLDDMQNQMAGVADYLENIKGLVPEINGSVTSALSFSNMSLDIFGCELKPNVAVSDFYVFANGGASQPDSQTPSEKSVDDAAGQAKPNVKPSDEIPFARPSKEEADLELY
jgi:enamine deaminase RidA (YjgF/YER057c/UK114 family)|tara:strand:+ start:4200 stop:5993 length:1794 start_codon:yes stop_codon:yes gene_type:complete